MSDEIHVEDVGTEFRILITEEGTAVDLSTATLLQIIFRKPDSTTLEVDADYYTDGTDGLIKYNVVDGDIDQAGQWRIQAYVEVGSAKYCSSTGTFKVLCNL